MAKSLGSIIGRIDKYPLVPPKSNENETNSQQTTNNTSSENSSTTAQNSSNTGMSGQDNSIPGLIAQEKQAVQDYTKKTEEYKKTLSGLKESFDKSTDKFSSFIDTAQQNMTESQKRLKQLFDAKPAPPELKLDMKNMMNMIIPIIGLCAIFGGKTGNALLNMGAAISGFYKGWVEGKKNQYEEALTTYKKNLDQWNSQLEKVNADLQLLKNSLSMSAEQYKLAIDRLKEDGAFIDKLFQLDTAPDIQKINMAQQMIKQIFDWQKSVLRAQTALEAAAIRHSGGGRSSGGGRVSSGGVSSKGIISSLGSAVDMYAKNLMRGNNSTASAKNIINFIRQHKDTIVNYIRSFDAAHPEMSNDERLAKINGIVANVDSQPDDVLIEELSREGVANTFAEILNKIPVTSSKSSGSESESGGLLSIE